MFCFATQIFSWNKWKRKNKNISSKSLNLHHKQPIFSEKVNQKWDHFIELQQPFLILATSWQTLHMNRSYSAHSHIWCCRLQPPNSLIRYTYPVQSVFPLVLTESGVECTVSELSNSHSHMQTVPLFSTKLLVLTLATMFLLSSQHCYMFQWNLCIVEKSSLFASEAII